MNTMLFQKQSRSLLDDEKTCRKLDLNYRRNKEYDQTKSMDELAPRFRYEDCNKEYWQPEEYSLMYGTPLWQESSRAEKLILNHLYWVAYYSQIISAEIATIVLNQTSAAGLNTLEDFRLVCDTLDLESAQERAHIAAFKYIGEQVEEKLFGERLFTYPMRSLFAETMVFADTNRIKQHWREIQLRMFAHLSAGNAFLGCQYFTVRGLRTLNGKMIQFELSRYYRDHPEPECAPIPSKISHFHFLDESYHFNSSSIISHDVLRSLKPPTSFEKWVANSGIRGCQNDHYHFSAAVKGIFWYEPALFGTLYKLLRSSVFGMEEGDAKQMLRRCFTQESQAVHESHEIHTKAAEAYMKYLEPLDFIDRENKTMSWMRKNTVEKYLSTNERELERFFKTS